jgi:hypothetical protein
LGIRSKRSTTQGDAWLLRLCTPHPTPSCCFLPTLSRAIV